MAKKKVSKKVEEFSALANSIKDLIGWIGDDPERAGLKETPGRVLKAWQDEWGAGYNKYELQKLIKLFQDESVTPYDQMVIVDDIEFASHCVVGSTFVETPRGRIPIKYLKDHDWVYTVNPDTAELGVVQCRNPRMTRARARLVRVYTDNDTVICTPDHKFLTYNRGWAKAESLVADDSIVSLYRQTAIVGHVYLRAQTKPLWPADNVLLPLTFLGKRTAVAEHTFIAKKTSKKLWIRKEVTHHIDERPWNNVPENLERLSITEHNRKHERLKDYNTSGTANYKQRVEAVAESSKRLDVRTKRSETLKAYWKKIRSDPEAYSARTENMNGPANHTVIGVEKLSVLEDVWCMDVPETNTFFANGMAVHNCEHHLAPFFGRIAIGYIPSQRGLVGLSKLVRVVNHFSRRLQVQERMTAEIAEFISLRVSPDVAVSVEATHMCMASRGVRSINARTRTSALRGAFLNEAATAQEFFAAAHKGR